MESTVDNFERLYDEYADAIFRHCFFRTGDRERAQELMQDTFMKTWEYIAAGNEIRNMKAFLYKVAGNLVINEVSRRKQHVSLEALQEAGFDPSASDQLENGREAALDGALCLRKLSLLSETDRMVLVYRYIDGLSVKEIALQLEESPNVVSVRMHRALKKLRTFIEEDEKKQI